MDLAPFESPRALIESAKENLLDFEAGCEAFLADCGYRIVKDFDTERGEIVIKLRFDGVIPHRLRTKASTIINDLRHALDQALCDGALMLGAKSARGIYFPFAKNAAQFPDMLRKNCTGVRTDLRDFVAAFNPYFGGDNVLYALNQLVGRNKHQRIIAVGIDACGFAFHSVGLKIVGLKTIGINKWNDARNELEFARLNFRGEINMYFTVPFEIVLGQAEVVGGQNAAGVFRDFASKVESVVAGIEAETHRLL